MINWKYVAKRFARRAFNWRYNFRELGKDNANNIRMLQDCRRERDQLRAELEEAKRTLTPCHCGAVHGGFDDIHPACAKSCAAGHARAEAEMDAEWKDIYDFMRYAKQIGFEQGEKAGRARGIEEGKAAEKERCDSLVRWRLKGERLGLRDALQHALLDIQQDRPAIADAVAKETDHG